MRVGIEVGGTFTDLVAIGPDGIRVTKVPSVPLAPDEGALNALLASGIAISSIEELRMAQRLPPTRCWSARDSPTAFVTTKGFRDISGFAAAWAFAYLRSRISETYAGGDAGSVLRDRRAHPCRRHSRDAAGCCRCNPALVAGAESRPLPGRRHLPPQCLCQPGARKRATRPSGIALPDLHVTISSDITREFREFERASTTTLSAYVQPVVDRYIQRFRQRLAAEAFRGRFSVMQSNGGRLPAEAMRANAINTLLSGPAAGVIGAVRQTGRSGYRHIVTLDIGGTSTDVCLVTGGVPKLTQEFHIDGLPIRIPLLDINTIGAGGGSIVWVDEGGMLRVGPRSAGADPGPACYGRGGSLPTLTDAHVVRGTVRPEAFLGGRMRIDAAAAARALAPIAQRFGLALEAAADSAIALANANIVRAIQLISTERGHDPRDYVLVPYGGAGPLHAARVAEELGIVTIVVPPAAGIISAYGLIASDFVLFESMTRKVLAGDSAAEVLREVFRQMQGRALERAGANWDPGSARLHTDGRDALCRSSLRGAGVVRGVRAGEPAGGRRAQEVRRRASARLLLRRGDHKTH